MVKASYLKGLIYPIISLDLIAVEKTIQQKILKLSIVCPLK